MKARRVVVEMEVETSATIKELKNPENWVFSGDDSFQILQKVSVNVIKKDK